ncbi:MAG: Ig-like domain-containing protein [Bacteroidota bacterium]
MIFLYLRQNDINSHIAPIIPLGALLTTLRLAELPADLLQERKKNPEAQNTLPLLLLKGIMLKEILHLKGVIFRTIWLGCFILLASSMWAQQRAYVGSSFPRNEATNLQCNTFITVNLEFPAESQQVDPATLTPEAFLLYPEDQSHKKVKTRLAYNAEHQYIQITPRELLDEERAYILELTNTLVDDRGFSLKPFQLRFQTGLCSGEKKAAPPVAARGEEEEPEIAEDEGIPQPILHMTFFAAAMIGDSVDVRWETQREFMMADFTIDRSADRKEFMILDRVGSTGDSEEKQAYQWIDVNPMLGWNYYRLTFADIYGEIDQSDTVAIFREDISITETEVPKDGALDIRFVLKEQSTMAFILKNPRGKIVKRKAGLIKPMKDQLSVSLQGLRPGTYLALLRTPTHIVAEKIRINRP